MSQSSAAVHELRTATSPSGHCGELPYVTRLEQGRVEQVPQGREGIEELDRALPDQRLGLGPHSPGCLIRNLKRGPWPRKGQRVAA